MLGIKTKIKKYLNTHYGMFSELINVRISPVGYFCTAACPMCWRMNITPKEINNSVKSESTRLTLEDYKKLFVNIPKSVKNVDVVGGGEPLMFPKIGELFKIIKQKNICGRLITNGSLLNKDIIRNLIDCSWDTVRISLHAASAKAYIKVLGVSNFEKVIDNVKLLIKMRNKEKRPWVSLLFVIQKGNFSEVIKFAQLAESLKVDEIEFDSLIPTNRSLLLKPTEKKRVINNLTRLRSKLHIQNNIDDVLEMFSTHPLWSNDGKNKDYFKDKSCQIVQSNVDIGSDGNVVPCCIAYGYYKYSNIREKSLGQIWNEGQKFRQELRMGKFRSFCYKMCNYKLAKK